MRSIGACRVVNPQQPWRTTGSDGSVFSAGGLQGNNIEQHLTLFYTIGKDGADLGPIGIAFEAKIRAARIMVRSHRFNADRILEELEDVQGNKSI